MRCLFVEPLGRGADVAALKVKEGKNSVILKSHERASQSCTV